MIKTAIIGCGNIGSQISKFIDQEHKDTLCLDYLVDVDENNIFNIKNKLVNNKPESVNLDEAIEMSDLIIECAHPVAAQYILNYKNIDSGKKFIIASTGGAINFTTKIDNLKKSKIFFPSGAISGLDAIGAVRNDIEFLSITTTKSPKGLDGAPYILKNNIQIDQNSIQEIFSGGLEEAIKGFPKNINVAATLFLATRFCDIKIKIISDPEHKDNVHEIFAKGVFGEIKTITKNKPSINPKTSQLAIYSIFDLINNLV
ncbi:DUF108 domain-containing protein [Patescibacteria group bacterium]|nr:DUF108 domain-containing protein [Patescibacteria group bacterium]